MFSPIIYIYIFTKVFLLLGRVRQRSATLSLYPSSHTAPSSSEVRPSVISKSNRRYFFACFRQARKVRQGETRAPRSLRARIKHTKKWPVFQSVIGLLKQGQNVKLLDVSAEGGEQFVGWFPVRNAGNKVELDSLASQW